MAKHLTEVQLAHLEAPTGMSSRALAEVSALVAETECRHCVMVDGQHDERAHDDYVARVLAAQHVFKARLRANRANADERNL